MYNQSPPLATIRNWDVPLTAKERKYICTTLINTIKNYYVHLPIKEKGFAIDPVQELRLLEGASYDEDNNMSFLRKLQRIFLKLNDRHTTLVMPKPWSDLVAFIPVVIERYYENNMPVYIVTKKLFGYENKEMQYGLRITHWNGTEIDKYIEVLSETSQGANRSAASKLTLSSLTIRSLAYSFPPEEDWVVLSCVNKAGEIQTFSFPWRVYYNAPKPVSAANPTSGSVNSKIGDGVNNVSLDRKQLANMKFQKQFFGKQLLKKRIANKYALQEYGTIMKYGIINTTSGDTGYLRIFSFEVGNVDTFITKMDQILQTLPQEKLIIDIRGNPGGIIPSGERLVQLLTKNQITPSPVAFRNTPSTKGFGGIQDFSRWKRSLDLMEETGAIFSQYYPLSTFDNLPVYRYPGKAALIIDSLVYSTADFVTADFKDNNIGPIIGVDPRTGAGGANVWPYETLVYYAQKVGNMDVGLLPKGIGLNVAMRRSIRTGIDQGLPVEDLGTKADIVHAITANDLLYDNVDLINFTASKLV
jgi:hypothetical protein